MLFYAGTLGQQTQGQCGNARTADAGCLYQLLHNRANGEYSVHVRIAMIANDSGRKLGII